MLWRCTRTMNTYCCDSRKISKTSHDSCSRPKSATTLSRGPRALCDKVVNGFWRPESAKTPTSLLFMLFTWGRCPQRRIAKAECLLHLFLHSTVTHLPQTGNFPHFTTFAPLLRYLYQISSAVHSLFWFSPAAGAVVSTEPSIKGSAVTHSDTHGGFAVTESSIIHLKNCWTRCQKSQQHVSLWSGKAISSVTASCPRLARLDMAGREDLCNVRGIG